MSKKSKKDRILTLALCVIVIGLLFTNIWLYHSPTIDYPVNVGYDKAINTLSLSSLTLKQKIAQMIIAYGEDKYKEEWQKMLIGGVHFGSQTSKEEYMKNLKNFQDGAVIPFFATIDLEGCVNPFENFQSLPTLHEIKTEEQAYQLGQTQGKLLKEMGFSINFAPVVDLEDNVWKCRNFIGTPFSVSNKANAYIKGLQENGIIATSKHYPGKTLSFNDPHGYITYASIEENDLLPFKDTIANNVSAIMISHLIVNGAVDSESKPATVSEKLIRGLREHFGGLIITDEIDMLGLKSYYSDPDKMYVDLFKADNDVIIQYHQNPKELYHLISVVEDAVEDGQIDEKRIDRSVTRILNAKGINVIE
jgi:beta-N-acetylhexosaminidase